MTLDLSQVRLTDITDTDGAVKRLRARFGKMSPERIRQFVKGDRLHPLIFEDGVLVERKASANTRGRDLFFLLADLDAMPKPVQGYPRGKPRS